MIRWIVERYAPRMGYRKVLPRNVGEMWIHIPHEDLRHMTQWGLRKRAEAFDLNSKANKAHDLLDEMDGAARRV